MLWQELSDDEGTYQAHDIVFDNQGRPGSHESGVTKECYPLITIEQEKLSLSKEGLILPC